MNPYLLAALAMCGVVIVAAVGTSYLAVYFTRRAKDDVRAALNPLAELLGGEADVENAEVTGTYHGTHVIARMASAAAGTVRLWQTDVIDAAGGHGWNYVYSRGRAGHTQPTTEIVADSEAVRPMLEAISPDALQAMRPGATDWVQIEYNPAGGYVRGARPMHGRNDIPGADVLEQEIQFLISVGDENRRMQEQLRQEGR